MFPQAMTAFYFRYSGLLLVAYVSVAFWSSFFLSFLVVWPKTLDVFALVAQRGQIAKVPNPASVFG